MIQSENDEIAIFANFVAVRRAGGDLDIKKRPRFHGSVE